MQGRGRGNVAAERLCGVLFVGLTPLKGYFYINLGGTLNVRFSVSSVAIPHCSLPHPATPILLATKFGAVYDLQTIAMSKSGKSGVAFRFP